MESYWEIKRLGDLVSQLEIGKRPKGGVQGIESGIPSIGAEHLDNNGNFKFQKIKNRPYNSSLATCYLQLLTPHLQLVTCNSSLVTYHFPILHHKNNLLHGPNILHGVAFHRYYICQFAHFQRANSIVHAQERSGAEGS